MIITIKLRDRLVRAADKAGRTFNEEIQHRLEASFGAEEPEMQPLTDAELERFAPEVVMDIEDWGYASGYMAAILDDKPSQSEAIIRMMRWFNEQKLSPSLRELKAFFDHAFK